MQVEVKNSCELKRYVSQNISSNSWNLSVFWLNLFSARLCCIFLIDKLLELLRVFLESDKVCFPLVVKRFIHNGSKG